ncbi:hypothetical protein [Vibrio parahaemolyticus]
MGDSFHNSDWEEMGMAQPLLNGMGGSRHNLDLEEGMTFTPLGIP